MKRPPTTLLRYREWFSFLAITGVFFASFFLLGSPWLDDWDSIQFVLAVDEFSLQKHQPHPPGYLAYILMARAVRWVTGDAQSALLACSALAGALSIALLYLLGNRLFGPPAGIIAALLFSVAPAVYQMSLVAMADIVILPLYLGAGWLYLRGTEDDQRYRSVHLALASFLLGWGLGVRPQWIFLCCALALVAAVRIRSLPRLAVATTGGVAGTLAWLLPSVQSVGGLGRYLDLCQTQFGAHPESRSKFSFEEISAFVRRFTDDWKLALALILASALLSLVFLVFTRRTTSRVRGTGLKALILAVLAATGVATALLFHPLTFKRVLLPSLPAFALLLSGQIGRAHV